MATKFIQGVTTGVVISFVVRLMRSKGVTV